MKDGKYCIAIMSVGSGVGQSVITSCNLSKLPIRTIGFDINPFAFGGYECDEYDEIPEITSNIYLPELIKKCIKHSIDIIIPGLDEETLILAENHKIFDELGVKLISSDFRLICLVREKERMCQELNQYADIFIESYSLVQARKLYAENQIGFPLIAKPRDGSGSNGIVILLKESDFDKINDSKIIQEIAIPIEGDRNRGKYLESVYYGTNLQVSEISIQVVADRKGKIIGKMMSYNKLKGGVPIEITPFEDDNIWAKIDLILPRLRELGHKGPLNLQGRMTDNGFKVFEINARFTGITGLRAILGFNEVEACIKEWLKLEETKLLDINYNRFGIRQVTDKSIWLDNDTRSRILPKSIDSNMEYPKSILVTGANGYLGREVVKKLITEEYRIIALVRTKEQFEKAFDSESKVIYATINELIEGRFDFGKIDCIVHCAFGRPHRSFKDIAESLKFTSLMFSYANKSQVPSIINISSKSVYGTTHSNNCSETEDVTPETAYAQAKYAAELMLINMNMVNKHFNGTSLRLSTLSGGAEKLSDHEITMKLVKKVINKERIQINGGKQQIERLDVRDAANAISITVSERAPKKRV